MKRFILLSLITLFSVLLSAKTVVLTSGNIFRQLCTPNTEYIIKAKFDLNGKNLYVPDGCQLSFQKGMFLNGTVVGKDTGLTSTSVAFSNVSIQGTWNVPVISTSYFNDLSIPNSLRNVFALCNPKIFNKVIIGKGNYYVDINKKNDTGITVSNKTHVILNGNIILKPNNLEGCSVIGISGKDITISGKGKIIGDKKKHLGTSGEWGMGLNIWGASHVCVKGISICDCWGDCIYIGGKSSDINISNCKLQNGRRQGISITSARNVVVRECNINDVFGTAPQYALDVEPNKNDTVDNVIIESVTAKNCFGGFVIAGHAEGSRIGAIVFNKCTVASCNGAKYPFRIIRCDAVTITECNINSGDKNAIYIQEVQKPILKRNKTNSSQKKHIIIKEYVDNICSSGICILLICIGCLFFHTVRKSNKDI